MRNITRDLKFTHKVTPCNGTVKQSICKAVKFILGTVAGASGYLLPGQGDVVEILQTVNPGFNVLNSGMPHHSTIKIKSAYGTCLEEQDEALNRLHNLFVHESDRKSHLLSFQSGLCISI